MSGRLTLDFHDPIYVKRLKLLAAEKGRSVRELVMEALDAYFENSRENRALLKLAENAFDDEWLDDKDSVYDSL